MGSAELLALAQSIQKAFPRFYLAGGTVLMLRYAHRISTDIDFFSEKPFSYARLQAKLRKLFHPTFIQRHEDAMDSFIGGIKVSFLFFPFQNILPIVSYKGVRMASDYDIFLNKLYAAGRRAETKAVIDIAYLWKRYRWGSAQLRHDFMKKFDGQDIRLYAGALGFREDYPGLGDDVYEVIRAFLQALTQGAL